MIDLVCLVADQNMKAVVETLLTKHLALGIRPLRFAVVPHPQHDPGCYATPAPLLGGYLAQAHHGLVVMDQDWDGVPAKTAIQLEMDIDSKLSAMRSGWGKSVVIDPELEVWLFTRSPRLEEALGWRGREPDLLTDLAARGVWPATAAKPANPKSAMKWALSRVGKQTSSSIYRQIADKLGLAKCIDPAFARFRTTLQGWFPAA